MELNLKQMKFENLWYVALQISVLLLSSTARTVKDLYEKKVSGKLGGFMTFIVSVLGGLMMATLVSISTENLKWIILASAIGSWGGGKSLDLLQDLLHNRFNLKDNGEDTDEIS